MAFSAFLFFFFLHLVIQQRWSGEGKRRFNDCHGNSARFTGISEVHTGPLGYELYPTDYCLWG